MFPHAFLGNSDPKVWGPPLWAFLHRATFAYPRMPHEDHQAATVRFFVSLAWLLPCERCAYHYAAFLRDRPPEAHSRQTLSRWLVDLHNHINRQTGARLWSYAEAERAYG